MKKKCQFLNKTFGDNLHICNLKLKPITEQACIECEKEQEEWLKSLEKCIAEK